MSFGFRCKCCKGYFEEFDEHGFCPYCHGVLVETRKVTRTKDRELLSVEVLIHLCDDIEGVD